jgi:hypothetical protein
MRSILVIATIFLFAFACNQIVYNQKIKADEIPKSAVVSADKMNIFYAWVDNPISVSVPGYKSEDIIVSISGGTIRQDTNGYPFKYIVNVPGDGRVRTSKISTFVKVGADTIPIETKEFRVRLVPRPTPKFGSKESGPIGRGEIALVKYISVVHEDLIFTGISWRCTSFKMVFFSKETGEKQTFSANSAELTNDMKTVLNNAVIGDKFIITDIYAATKNIVSRKLNSEINLQIVR